MVTTRLYTVDDLKRLTSAEPDYELIAGELVTMAPPNFGHGRLQGRLVSRLLRYAEAHSLGEAIGEAGFLLSRNPDTVLAPDVAFIARHRLPQESTGFLELAPDLAVEIVSPSNTPGEIERKIAIYLQSGVRSVWIVYPQEREVVVHTPTGPPGVFAEQDHIDGGEVLPGLTLAVADLFA